MKAHPLFNEDPTDLERMSRDIGFLQVYKFQGSKRVALPNQWDPDEIQTVEDLYNAVGKVAGRYEVMGRDSVKKTVVDRVLIEIEPPKVDAPSPHWQPPAPPAAEPIQPQPPGVPMMMGGGLQIPQGIDPQTALVMMFMNQSNAQLQAAREESRANQTMMMNLFLGLAKSQADTTVGLANAFSGRAGGGGGGESGVESGFIKGIETMAALVQGHREGGAAEEDAKPASFGEIAKNIADSLASVRDIAKATSGVTNAGAPVIPPGDPTT